MKKAATHSSLIFALCAARCAWSVKERQCGYLFKEGSMSALEWDSQVKPYKTIITLLEKMTSEEFNGILERSEEQAPMTNDQ